MSKLCRARSLLYRRQILQEIIRWKALDEIYKIYMLLHRSNLDIPENFRQCFFAFVGKVLQTELQVELLSSPPRFLRAVCFPFLGFPAAPSCILGRMLLR